MDGLSDSTHVPIELIGGGVFAAHYLPCGLAQGSMTLVHLDTIRMQDVVEFARESHDRRMKALKLNIDLIPEARRATVVLNAASYGIGDVLDEMLFTFQGMMWVLRRCLVRAGMQVDAAQSLLDGMLPGPLKELFQELAGRSGLLDPKALAPTAEEAEAMMIRWGRRRARTSSESPASETGTSPS